MLWGWSFSQNVSSLALRVCDSWCFEYILTNHRWLNQLINDKAVHRTAPATPGLLINGDGGDDTEGDDTGGKNVEDDDNNDENEEDAGTDEDVEDDDLGDDTDTGAVPYLLLYEVEAHGDHGDAKEEVEGAEGDPGLAVFHLLVRGEVTEADGGQSDETEVGTGQKRGLGWSFSKHRPSGPMLSISRNVRLSVCLSVCLSVHSWGTV